MAVRIRLKQMGRKHRPFYRVCAMDARTPRDGKVLEELGSYDPMVPDTDARAVLNGERIDYWLGVGALPTDKVKVLIKKYGSGGTRLEEQKSALERMAQPKAIPDPGAPASMPKKKEEAKPAAKEAASDGKPAAEASDAKESAEAAAETPTDAASADATSQGQSDQSKSTEESAPAAAAETSKSSDAGEETKTKEDD